MCSESVMLQRQESLTDPIVEQTRARVLETAPVSALSPRLQAVQTRKRGLEADQEAESARKKTRQDAAELFKDLTTASRKIDTDIPEGMITDKAEYDRLLPGLQAEYRRIVTESPESTLYSLLEHLGQKEFALLEFGPERIALWLSNNHTIRSIWEHSEPTEQCRSGAGFAEWRSIPKHLMWDMIKVHLNASISCQLLMLFKFCHSIRNTR